MGSESKNGAGLGELSPATRKMIQNLKEIVSNCPETEIYAVLRECNMDPDDAVQRLLSQDTFHEVKSKRERRKEMKETQEIRPRFTYSGSTRGTRSASERNGWGGSSQANYEEGNVAHKGDNVQVAPSSTYLTAHVKGEIINHRPSFNSDSLYTDSRGQSIGTGDGIFHTLEPSPAQQPVWSGTSAGHLSMADIVRLGRPSSKHSHISSETTSYTRQDAVTTNLDHYYEKPSQAPTTTQAELHRDLHPQKALNVSEMSNKSDTTGGQNVFLEEQSTAPSLITNLDASAVPDSDKYVSQSNLYSDDSELSRNVGLENILASKERDVDQILNSDNIVSANATSRHKNVTSSVGASHSDLTETGSGSNSSDALADNDVAKFQHLSLGKEDSENNLILPSHLQAFTADCSHLSFGTYKSGKSSASIGLSPSNELNDDLQEAATMFPACHLETRNLEHNADDSIGSLYNTHREIADSRNYDLQSELMKQDVPVATLGSETDFINPTLHDYKSIERSAPELSFARTEPNVRNISVQNERTMSKNTLVDLVQHLQSLQAPNNLQGQFHATQSLPSRHSNVDPSISNPNIPFSEHRNPVGAAVPASLPSSVLPQQRVGNYLPVEQPSNNIMGYPGLPQSYSHLPSTFPSAYGGGDEFQQSLADLKYSLSDYGASVNRFPGGAPAGYGTYGVSNNDPGRYMHSSSASPIANGTYGDVYHPRFKDGNHFAPLQQNTSPSTLNYGPGSRMPSSVQESAYFSSLGQNQQYAGYRQAQQQQQHSQQYGSLEYSDLYRSQTGMTREHQLLLQQQQQQRNFGSLTNGALDLSSQQLNQLQQFWQQNH